MESQTSLVEKITLSLAACGFTWLLLQLCYTWLLKPKRLRAKLQAQGIRGPSPSCLYGNIPEMTKIQLQTRSTEIATCHLKDIKIIHDWADIVFSHIERWRNEYGPIFMYSAGCMQVLCITDPKMVKEVSTYTGLNFGKPSYLSKDRGPLLGHGILSSSGLYWVHQRKIIAPEFYIDKVKGMLNLMVESTFTMLKSWEREVEKGGGMTEIKVDDDLRRLSADIISKACFGSSYSQGEKIFTTLGVLQKTMSKSNVGVPGLRYLPTKNNREIWKLEKEIKYEIVKVVRAQSGASREKNLLQLILEAAKNNRDNDHDMPKNISPDKFIVDNCKNIYFAGHETTAISASWCLMLLAEYPVWQAQVRAEVLQICGDKVPDADMLRNMKVLTMVIQEALRLYPPVAYVVREALEDMKLKSIKIPKGINVQIVIPVLHRLPELWGPDVDHFNPVRFAKGITGACRIPQAYMPFGVGTRICVGQHFAMVELKVILALIVSRFSFSLSPAYQHSLVFRLVIEPENGIYLHVKRL
uniref:Cytochrome P450 n=1 Tax=Nothapodytes nimmoniana TaxID=159386 RepID=A0A7L7RBH2_NOTNI|nr:cytochrome P450 [Nothapodytes nimmoniana]